jgi:hypothetical protein
MEKSLSQVLEGISSLLLGGWYPANHAKLIVEACTVLEALASAEKKREEEAAPVVEEVKADDAE